jgi:acetyltransferase-like isoleucine patch superfamily enzyme
MENLEELARQLMPYLLKTHAIWGDASRLIVGRNVSLINTLFNTSSGNITIENDVFFGHNVCVLTGSHFYEYQGAVRKDFPKEGNDIIIKKYAWIASNATIIGPCEIGENSVIGAGSVVLGNVPAGCLYAGIPAKFIKNIDFKNAVSA